MEWTKPQAETIETRGKNILVSAAAGSGKTAVLVERIKQLILKDKVGIDKFLITTFTNAASAEMRQRLERAIKDELKKNESDKAFLRKQLRMMPTANISTFHTFAISVMRDYFYLTDLEPGFKISDDTQMDILQSEAIDAVFEERFEEDYEAFKDFLTKYSGERNERRIKENIIQLYKEMRSIPDYLDWAENRTDLMNGDNPAKDIGVLDFIIKEGTSALEYSVDCFGRAFNILHESGLDTLAIKAEEDLEALEALSSRLGKCSDNTEAMNIIAKGVAGMNYNQMRATKDEKDEYELVKEQISTLRNSGKKVLADVYSKYFSKELSECNKELNNICNDTKYLTGLIKDFQLELRRCKREHNIVDFDDVMHYAIDILRNDKAAGEYRDKFEYIFIDEFQDSNMLQEEIVSKICRENNLFMVGDVKQSIYKFRLAEPEIFKRKYNYYKEDSNELSTKIDLSNNFRSKCNVTKTVNSIFERVMEDYDEDAMLNCSIDEKIPGYETELILIDRKEKDDKAENESADAVIEDMGELPFIKSVIENRLGQIIYDVKNKQERKVDYRDIVILSRGKSALSGIETYLNNEGIPAYGETAGGYFETVEIEVFINLMKIIDNARQDIPLISTMHSIIFDFTPAEMAKIRMNTRDGSYYEAVEAYIENGHDEEIRGKVSAMVDKIEYWKGLKKTTTLEELIRTLLFDTGYYDYCSGLPVGDKRAANLRLLIEKAADFESGNYSGLYGFLSYVDAMKRSSISIGKAKTVGEGENVVRVMTVHKSKGLEFPVVILTGAGKAIKFRGRGTDSIMHKDFAIGMANVDRKLHSHSKTILQKVIEGKKAQEELEEEIRILYVALTRAMDSLVIIGTSNDTGKLENYKFKPTSFLDMVYEAIQEGGGIIERLHPQIAGAKKMTVKRRQLVEQIFYKAEYAEREKTYWEIDRRLSFEYPYRANADIKSKYSVTELMDKRTGRIPEFKTVKPDFNEDGGDLEPFKVGTVMHKTMELVDFRRCVKEGEAYIREVVDGMLDKGFINEEEKKVININNIMGFFESDVGVRCAKSGNLSKEKEFILEKEINGAKTIVQGVIDCYFEEDNEMVLIDYKNVLAEDADREEQIIEKYRSQIKLYEEALQEATGKNVKEAYLYLFIGKKFLKIGD